MASHQIHPPPLGSTPGNSLPPVCMDQLWNPLTHKSEHNPNINVTSITKMISWLLCEVLSVQQEMYSSITRTRITQIPCQLELNSLHSNCFLFPFRVWVIGVLLYLEQLWRYWILIWVLAGTNQWIYRFSPYFQFPRCDGSHNQHNKETGDNVGPLVCKRANPSS